MNKSTLMIIAVVLLLGAAVLIAYAVSSKPALPTSAGGNNNAGNNNTGGNNTSGGSSGGGTNTSGGGSSSGNAGNNTNRIDGMDKSSINELAKSFREEFQSWYGATTSRCGLIASVNALTNAQLTYFAAQYGTSYNLPPYDEMNAASTWCWYSDADDYPLFEKLKALVPVTTPVVPGQTTNPNDTINGVKKSVIENVAKVFNEKFTQNGALRCSVIAAANQYDDAQLLYFSSWHKSKYGVTPKQMMDAAWVWCPTNLLDNKLYDRLI